MRDQSRLTRRTLLKRAGAGTVLVLGAGFLLERALDHSDDRRGYLPGFNDDFLLYSHSGFARPTMEKVRGCNGVALRFGVDWGQVQAAGPDSFDWSSCQSLYGLALEFGLELLPTVFGCPEWAGPVQTAPRWAGNEPELPALGFRTCSPEYDQRFGAFADATLKHFDAYSKWQDRPTVVRAVEILNEPNVWTFGDVPAVRVRELASAAAETVATSQDAGAYSRPMRVVSGGIAPVTALEPGNRLGHPPRVDWQEYLAELIGEGPIGFDVGIHSYESSKPPAGTLDLPEDDPADPFARGREYAEWQAGEILARIDRSLALAPGDIWLTETGASSGALWPTDIFSPAYRNRFGQQIQAEVLDLIAEGLRSRSRCRSMIVHRLYSDNRAEPPPGAGGTSPHHQSGVYESIGGPPKLAVEALADAWA